jgi:hypothetical protein
MAQADVLTTASEVRTRHGTFPEYWLRLGSASPRSDSQLDPGSHEHEYEPGTAHHEHRPPRRSSHGRDKKHQEQAVLSAFLFAPPPAFAGRPVITRQRTQSWSSSVPQSGWYW